MKGLGTGECFDLIREGWITLDTSDPKQQIARLDKEDNSKLVMLSGEVKIRQPGTSIAPDAFYTLVVLDESKAKHIKYEYKIDPKHKPKGFLICPVRGADVEDTRGIVESLESGKSDGIKWDIHWPLRDTDQEDDTGYRICEDNMNAIKESKRVFFVWDGKSQGSLFDLGMAFAFRKDLTCISLPERTPHKSFQNMATDWMCHRRD